MEKQIFITRHGETKWNTVRRMQGQKNSPLTEMGIKQAEWLKERLSNETIDIIYTSPLGRAYDTALILKGDRDIPLVCVDDLKELYFGSWEGRLKSDLEKEFKEKDYFFWNEPKKYIPTDGETLDELFNRVRNFYETCILSNTNTHILVVAHAIVLKAFLAYTQGKTIEELWSGVHLQPTSLTEGIIDQDKITYTLIGDTSHYKSKSSFNGWFMDEKKDE